MIKSLMAAPVVGLVGFSRAAVAGDLGKSDLPANNWGQEVKDCKSCYTTRGDYVHDQARDDQAPGYGREIHDLASPGKSVANPGK